MKNKIGYAIKQDNKIHIELDRRALKSNQITLIEKVNKLGHIYYDVIARAIKPNYEKMAINWANEFYKRQKNKSNKEFKKWIFK